MRKQLFVGVDIMPEYFFLVDYIEAFLWSVAYMLIAFVGYVNKDDPRLAMPKIALFTNFSWEVASVIVLKGSYFNQAGYIRFAWLIFDVFILLVAFRKSSSLPDFKKKIAYWSVPWIILTVIFCVGFNDNDLFMPVSAFIIDIEMAILFWLQRKKFDPSLRFHIAIFKLFGDILAGVYCSTIHYSIIVLAVGSFIFNILYLIYAVKELKTNPNIKNDFKNNVQLVLDQLRAKHAKDIKHRKRKYKKNKRKTKTHRKK